MLAQGTRAGPLDHEAGRGDVGVGEQRAGGGGGDQRWEAGGHAVVAGALEVAADPGDGSAECGERNGFGVGSAVIQLCGPSEQLTASNRVLTVVPLRLTAYPRPADARVAVFGLDGVLPGSRAVRRGEAEHLRRDGKHLAEPAQQGDVGQRLDAAFVPGDLRGRIAAATAQVGKGEPRGEAGGADNGACVLALPRAVHAVAALCQLVFLYSRMTAVLAAAAPKVTGGMK